MEQTKFDPAILRRRPDIESSNLFAWDASDALLLDLATEHLASSVTQAADVVVLNDSYGGVALGLTIRAGLNGIRVHQDLLTGEQALRLNAERLGLGELPTQLPFVDDGGAQLLGGAKLVLLKLPRSLAELEEMSQAIARFADPEVTVIAVGRIKHMSLAMNRVLAASFEEVTAGLARQKSRPLFASLPREAAVGTDFPRGSVIADLNLQVRAHGEVFAGASLDIGTRFLIEQVRAGAIAIPEFGTALDLGCGTGLLAVEMASAQSGLRVIATDRSAASIASAQATALANGVPQVEVLQDDAAASLPDGSVDLILLNPPFHSGAAVHSAVATKLFHAASRLLRPGGQLFTVYNRHLTHAKVLEKVVGRSSVLAQNSKFVILRSTRRS